METSDGQVIPLEGEEVALEFKRMPWTWPLFVRGLFISLGKSQGRLDRPPRPMRATVRGYRMIPEKLTLYRLVCEEQHAGTQVPLCYPESLFIGLIASLATHRAFPASPLGLIHSRQSLRLLRPIESDERLDLTASLAEVRETPRGYEFDMRMEVVSRDELVWDGTATLLSRTVATRKGETRKIPPILKGPLPVPASRLDVLEPTGRYYAKATGDYNPHHLWGWSARLLGYNKPIAHGMWSLARAVSEIAKMADLSGVVELACAFKRPLLMPSSVRLRFEAERFMHDNEGRFDIWRADDGEPILFGEIKRNPPPQLTDGDEDVVEDEYAV
ncbi:MAG: hypothetical protein H6684_15430 [Deltaproteobacteria bacterium]|nr:hypothetical protein [bacterium]MCB9475719.1 hypothetical protein [Deltaproteobacteria bacterium]MCB9479241.1 hypothetical protein [Deltaproteobacteria bacterium]MCB9490121.1 hypothetical protein [Deltaproteobacteria bacterium]